jgi:hypothetical protein
MRSGQTDYGGRTLAVPAIRHDGTSISVEFIVTLLREPTRALRGIGAILLDVSARRESNGRRTGASASWNVSLRRFEARLEAEKTTGATHVDGDVGDAMTHSHGRERLLVP